MIGLKTSEKTCKISIRYRKVLKEVYLMIKYKKKLLFVYLVDGQEENGERISINELF